MGDQDDCPPTGRPDQASRAQLVNPSSADLIRQQPWPQAFQDALLELRARREAGHWRLHKDPGQTTRKHKIRLTEDGTELKIGHHVPGAADVVADLQGQLERRWTDLDEAAFALDPSDPRAADVLRNVMRGRGRVTPPETI